MPQGCRGWGWGWSARLSRATLLRGLGHTCRGTLAHAGDGLRLRGGVGASKSPFASYWYSKSARVPQRSRKSRSQPASTKRLTH